MNKTVAPDSELYPGKDRLPYALTPIIEFARDNARSMNEPLEDVLTTLMAAVMDDGTLDAEETKTLLQQLLKVDRSNTGTLHVLDLLLQAGKQPAQREMERLEAKRRTAGKK